MTNKEKYLNRLKYGAEVLLAVAAYCFGFYLIVAFLHFFI
jgi:hypothetical protein